MFNKSTSVLLELWGLICSLTVCTECNKPFSLAVILRAHLRTHPGEKPRICARCEKSFSEATDLRRHIGEGSQVCTSALNATNHSVHLLFWVLAWGLTLEGSHTKYIAENFHDFLSFSLLQTKAHIWIYYLELASTFESRDSFKHFQSGWKFEDSSAHSQWREDSQVYWVIIK